MQTRRNFMKKAGLVGLANVNPKNIFSDESFVNRIYGSEMIREVLEEYKKKRPVTYKHRYSDDSKIYITFLKNNKIQYGCLGGEDLNGLNPLFIGEEKREYCSNYTTISRDKRQGLYSVEFSKFHIEFREEKGGFISSSSGEEVLMPLPNSEEFFKPYKELYNLVWEDIETLIRKESSDNKIKLNKESKNGSKKLRSCN